MNMIKSFLPALVRHGIRRFENRLGHLPFRLHTWDGCSEVIGRGRPQFDFYVRDPKAVARILLAPDPGFGEAYIDGQVDVDPLPRFLDAYLTAPVPALGWWRFFKSPRLSRVPISQQYRDIQNHYDRGNRFFSLWLDASRTYSCAYFRRPSDSLDDAQAAKVTHVLRKAQLRPGQSLLDIGSGWGALIIEAAERYGVRSHGITLSREQLRHTEELIRARGLEGRVSVELCDYRELAARRPRFDRIVTVGMMEHVGRRNLPIFLSAIQQMLASRGVCVLHSMMRRRETEVSPYIRRHIFPGAYVPSWREVVALLPELNFHLIDMESLRRHYAMTLSRWAERFESALGNVRSLGFDEKFIRMWRLYLQGCAASFRHGVLDLFQLVFTSGVNNDLRLTRQHLFHRQANRRERVLQLVCGLPGQRLPAGHLCQVDETLAAAS